MFGRTLFVLVNLLAACALAALAVAGAGFVVLGAVRPPPYREWAAQGVLGLLTAVIMAVGLLLWALLAASALVWLARGLRRILATFAPVRRGG